ncbi:MAG: fumarylacetoacetate hydrolase family protein [Sulfitobacter dubius]|uniref:fumarylacetoacetate hydrolase family protein n=1 Tax=Roseibium sp. TaxID=1936156 RepID=UPI003298F07D
MRFVRGNHKGQHILCVEAAGLLRGQVIETRQSDLLEAALEIGPAGLTALGQSLANGAVFDVEAINFLPPLPRPPKTVCVGLNYRDHTEESGYDQPDFPTFFARFPSSFIGHNAPMIEPAGSATLDFEGELAVVIGKPGRHIAKDRAHDHIAGFSVFNDGSVREYQFKAPQWMPGKNFDGTGAFGPSLVTADELPAGAKGLKIETRLNGKVVQSSNTDALVFSIAEIIAHLSEAMTLQTGDVIVSGTPSGIGHARDPKLYMRDGDVCEVTIEGLGTLRNPIVRQ